MQNKMVLGAIARPIPTKRELKVALFELYRQYIHYRKAHPDEKGTESTVTDPLQSVCVLDRKAHPGKRELKLLEQRRVAA